TLIAHNLPPKITNANKGDTIHQTAYKLLRKKLKEHEKMFGNFSDCRPLKGGKQWIWKNKDMQEKSDIMQARLQENLGAKRIDIDYEVSSESDSEIDSEIRSSSSMSD